MSTRNSITRLFKTALEDTYRHALTGSADRENPLPELVLPYFRQELTKLTDRILIRLHDRSAFALNRAVYEVDGVQITERPGMSLLEYALEGMESYHAGLGRFVFPDQYAMFRYSIPSTQVVRSPKGPFLPRVEINLKDRLMDFYRAEVLPRICATEEDEADSYGETVYVDADLLELLHERIGKGRMVAAIKVVANPDIWDVAHDRITLSDALKDPAREEIVINDAIEAGNVRYQLDPDTVNHLFRWIIDQTLDLEVEYLQRLLAEAGQH
jgi:monofunctional chorismate mutase